MLYLTLIFEYVYTFLGGLNPQKIIHQYCLVFSIAGKPLVNWLWRNAHRRVASGLRPRTQAAYMNAFRLFLAFTIFMDLLQPWVDLAVLTFVEFLIANNLSPASLQNYIAVLSHFFAIYGWPLEGLRSRKLCLMIKSVRVNSNLKPKIKGVLSVDMLKKLLINFDFVENALSIKSIVLLFLASFD